MVDGMECKHQQKKNISLYKRLLHKKNVRNFNTKFNTLEAYMYKKIDSRVHIFVVDL